MTRVLVLCAIAVGIAGIGHDLWAQQEPPSGWPWSVDVLDEIVADYKYRFAVWALGPILTIATDLFFWLALLEFVIAGIMYAVATPQAREAATGRLLIKIMLISFAFMLLTESSRWLIPLVNSFAGVGEQVTGRTLSPSQIVAYGVELSGDMLEATGGRQLLTNPMMAFYNALAAFGVFLSYVLIAAQVVLTLVHSYLLLSVGLFFLAFAAFRATVPLAENYLMACVFVGIKLMILYFLVAVGDALTVSWIEAARQHNMFSLDASSVYYVVAGVLTFAFIVWYIPNKVASQITGGASFGLAEAMRRTS